MRSIMVLVIDNDLGAWSPEQIALANDWLTGTREFVTDRLPQPNFYAADKPTATRKV